MRLQALALLSVCAVRLVAPGFASAQATNPPPAVPPAATPPAVPPPPAAAIAPAQSQAQGAPGTAPATPEPGAADQPALPTYPPSATPPEQALGPDGQVTPSAADPTSPPSYIEPMTPASGEVNIQAAPTIDEQLVAEPKSKLPSYLMWGVGGASLITGAVLGITALTAKSDFNDNPTYAAADRVEGRAIAADVALGLGAVLLITGTAFYLMPDSQESRPASATNTDTKRSTARLHLTPMLGRTNGGALTLQF